EVERRQEDPEGSSGDRNRESQPLHEEREDEGEDGEVHATYPQRRDPDDGGDDHRCQAAENRGEEGRPAEGVIEDRHRVRADPVEGGGAERRVAAVTTEDVPRLGEDHRHQRRRQDVEDRQALDLEACHYQRPYQQNTDAEGDEGTRLSPHKVLTASPARPSRRIQSVTMSSA